MYRQKRPVYRKPMSLRGRGGGGGGCCGLVSLVIIAGVLLLIVIASGIWHPPTF